MNRVCIKGVVMVLLLLLLHASGYAQDYTAPDTVPPGTELLADTAVTVTGYDSDEQINQKINAAPETRVFRTVPDSVIRNLQKQKDFAYANDPAYWKKKEQPSNEGDWIGWLVTKNWFKYMILTLMVAVLLFALIRIAISNRLVMFRGSRKSANAEEDELLQKENLAAMIQDAEAQNNFRLAVRYRYMKVLQDMDERKIISLNAQSTNWDYVNRMGSHPLKNKFLLLTRAYEYVWYGEFDLNTDQYGYLRTEFQQFENSVNR